MPFIAVVFVVSPIYIKFLETRRVWQFVIMLCAFTLSCLIGRENVNPLHSCAYFSIYYLFGIFCAQNYDFIRSRSIKFWIRLLWMYLMTLLFFTLAGDFVYGAVRVDIFKGIADFVPLFKVPECLLLLWLAYKLAKLSEALKKILKILAKYSFAIFFLHNFFITFFEELFFWTNRENFLQDTAWLYLVGFFMTIVVCIICILVAKLLKEKIGTNSRVYIGV